MIASSLPAKALGASRECRLPCLSYGIGTLRFYCEAMKRRAFTGTGQKKNRGIGSPNTPEDYLQVVQ